MYYDNNKVLYALDHCRVLSTDGEELLWSNFKSVDRGMLTCNNTAIPSHNFDSSRQIHLACNKTTSGSSVWGKASCSRRDEETKPQNVTSLKYKCLWPTLHLLAQGLPGDFGLTFTYASWYSQWHLETNYEYLKVHFINGLMELFSWFFNIYFTDRRNNRKHNKWSQSSFNYIHLLLFIWFRVHV